jgi:hypothetical protein
MVGVYRVSVKFIPLSGFWDEIRDGLLGKRGMMMLVL